MNQAKPVSLESAKNNTITVASVMKLLNFRFLDFDVGFSGVEARISGFEEIPGGEGYKVSLTSVRNGLSPLPIISAVVDKSLIPHVLAKFQNDYGERFPIGRHAIFSLKPAASESCGVHLSITDVCI